jgi:mannose-1-phosphate guanylyltransferase
MNSNNYIAIMAGGIGSRFWPSSTIDNPKQFLDILNIGKSLIRLTYERCLLMVPNENILIITNKRYKNLVVKHLPELPLKNILCEPSMNNTAPSVAYTALHIRARNSEAVFAVLPSDHMILKENAFVLALEKAFTFAKENNSIVTLGISPTRPDTGYGYIEIKKEDQAEIKKVISFREKPDVKIAQQYLQAGNYHWNAGMFVWSLETIISAFKKNALQIIDTLSQQVEKFGTDSEQSYIDEVYPETDKISVDYAILEKADNVYTLPVDIGWSDLGTWNSLHAYLDKDNRNNVIQSDKYYIEDVKDSIIRTSSEREIVIKGLDGYIVIDEPGSLLIYPKSDEQEIKSVVKKLHELK